MKRLSLILAIMLLAGCSGMRSTGGTSGSGGTSGTSGSGGPVHSELLSGQGGGGK